MKQPVLICYDGSDEARQAVDEAAALFGPRPAVVLNVAPAMTFAEGVAATSSLVPGRAFEDLNKADALRRAEAGAGRARRAGFDAEPRATIASTTGSPRSPVRCRSSTSTSPGSAAGSPFAWSTIRTAC
jgi:hypothetical protein